MPAPSDRNIPRCAAKPPTRSPTTQSAKVMSRLLLLFSTVLAYGTGAAGPAISEAIAQPLSAPPFTLVAGYDDEDDEEDFEDESDELPSPAPLPRRRPIPQTGSTSAYWPKPAATERLTPNKNVRAHARHGVSRRHVGYRPASHRGHARRNAVHHKPQYKHSHGRYRTAHRSSRLHVGSAGNRAKHAGSRHHSARANVTRTDHGRRHRDGSFRSYRQPNVHPRHKHRALSSYRRTRHSEHRYASHRSRRSAAAAHRSPRTGQAHGRRPGAAGQRHGFARQGATVHHARHSKMARHATTGRHKSATAHRAGRTHHTHRKTTRRVRHSRRHG
jgi:hypothetical protein